MEQASSIYNAPIIPVALCQCSGMNTLVFLASIGSAWVSPARPRATKFIEQPKAGFDMWGSTTLVGPQHAEFGHGVLCVVHAIQLLT